jgi:hypothetical protein
MMIQKNLYWTQKLTSGPAFEKGHVGLHHDVFHDHLWSRLPQCKIDGIGWKVEKIKELNAETKKALTKLVGSQKRNGLSQIQIGYYPPKNVMKIQL